jgi:C4-dicarboxylate-binding protein DctP
MKKYSKLLFPLLVLSLLLLFVSGCGEAQNTSGENAATSGGNTSNVKEIEKIEVRLAHNMPESHHTAKGMQMFADLVKEKSNGMIQIEVYPSGQLYNDDAIPEAVTSGAVEIGMTTFTKWAGLLPASEFWSLPGLFPNLDVVHRGLQEGIADIFKQELNNLGAEPLIWADYGFGYTASIKKPLDTKESYKGVKVRVLSPIEAKRVEMMGGTPVTLGGAEVEQALQRGTIDAATSGLTSFVARHYYEFTKYIVGPGGYGMFSVTANKKWWDGLSEQAKQMIREAAAETEKWISEELQKEEAKALKTLEEKGMKYIPLNKDEFKDVDDKIIDEYIQRSGEAGQKIIEIARKVLE